MQSTQRRARIRTAAGATLAIAALALAGCASGSAAPSASGTTTTTLKVGYAISTQANFYYAQQHDLFAEHGIKLEATSFANGTDLVTALVSGSLDVGMIGAPPTLTANAKGADLQVFGITVDQGDMDALYSSPDGGVKGPEGLRGQTVGTTQGSSSDVLLHIALDQAKVPWDEVNVQYLAPPALVAGYQRGDLKNVWTFSTPGSSIIAAGGKKLITASDMRLSSPLVYAASKKFIDSNTDALKRFLAAVDEGTKATNGNDEAWTAAYVEGSGGAPDSAKISAKYLSSNGVTTAKAADPAYVNSLTSPDGFAAVLGSYQDVMVKLGILESPVDTTQAVTDAVVK
jgi:NitT/TauT family transport system substrate-binding protein